MEILTAITDLLKTLGLTAESGGGWIVALLVTGFMVWRLYVLDKKYDEFVDKLSKVITAQEEEWRKLVSKTDDITYDMLQDSTKSMTMLSEKINTLQLILLQLNNGGKK